MGPLPDLAAHTPRPIDHDWSHHKNRRVCPREHANQEGPGKVPQNIASKHEEGDEGEQHRASGEKGAAQRFIQTGINDPIEWVTRAAAQVFPYPIQDDDRVIHRIPGDGQHRG